MYSIRTGPYPNKTTMNPIHSIVNLQYYYCCSTYVEGILSDNRQCV